MQYTLVTMTTQDLCLPAMTVLMHSYSNDIADVLEKTEFIAVHSITFNHNKLNSTKIHFTSKLIPKTSLYGYFRVCMHKSFC